MPLGHRKGREFFGWEDLRTHHWRDGLWSRHLEPPGVKTGWCKCMVKVCEECQGIRDGLHLCTHRMHGEKRTGFCLWCSSPFSPFPYGVFFILSCQRASFSFSWSPLNHSWWFFLTFIKYPQSQEHFLFKSLSSLWKKGSVQMLLEKILVCKLITHFSFHGGSLWLQTQLKPDQGGLYNQTLERTMSSDDVQDTLFQIRHLDILNILS